MKVIDSSEQRLEILIELPRFIIWFMLGPLVFGGGLFTLALLLGGEFLNGLTTGFICAAIVLAGRYFLTQRTRVELDAINNRIRILRSTMFSQQTREFTLDQLDGAEVTQNSNIDSDGGSSRATSTLMLVFTNTRPATRVPLSGWSVSGGGAGMLADTINDWLRERALRLSEHATTT